MTNPSPRRAQSASACRRSAVSTTPVGDWCAGVTTTARASLAASAVTTRPSSSTGTGTTRRPIAIVARMVSSVAALP